LLTHRGWSVLRVWEHEPATNTANRVEAELTRLRRAGCRDRSSTVGHSL
jgi:hypothetical protein